MIWRFTLHLKGLEEFTNELANRLYEAGCDDGTLSSSNHHTEIGFDREAKSLNDAIRSAISNVRSVGLDVERVEIEEQDLIDKELAQWQTAQ